MPETMEERAAPTKWRAILDFVKLMKIDAVIVLFALANISQTVPVAQLAEDKMCINQLLQPQEYCLKLTTNHSDDENAALVLQHANTLSQWQTVITSVPATILSAFLGYWLDKYPQYFRMMVILPCGALTIEILIMLTNAFFFKINSWAILISWIPFGLGGGYLLVFGAAYTYISWSSPSHLLIIRFAVLECIVQAAILIGTFISGNILVMTPWIEGQPENYLGILSLSLIFALSALILALNFEFVGARKPLPENSNNPHGQVLKDVFNPSRLKSLLTTLFKKRSKNGRIRLIMLVVSATLSLASIHGEATIAYPYAQAVYGWTSEHYTSIFPIVNIVPALMTALGPQILKSLFKLPDTLSGAIGSISLLSMYLVRGSMLNPTGFTLSYAIGSLNKVSVVSFRSLISVVVDPDEAAKIFTIITALDCWTTLGSAFMYTSIFNATIEDNPGLIFKIDSIILLFPLATCVWLEFTRRSWQTKKPANIDDKEKGTTEKPGITVLALEERFANEVREHGKSQNSQSPQ